MFRDEQNLGRSTLGLSGESVFFYPLSLCLTSFPPAGQALAIAGTKALGRNLTPFPKPADHAKLVQHGIYEKIRHPLYTAVILAGFGWALLWLSWPALLAAAAVLPFFHAKSCREEGFLRQKFPGYREYEERTRRFIPWLY